MHDHIPKDTAAGRHDPPPAGSLVILAMMAVLALLAGLAALIAALFPAVAA